MYQDKKIIATIEARMTSSRLPGKVLMDLCGKPALQHIIERMRRSRYIDDVIVATTINDSDNPIIDLCNDIQCKYYRGSEDDVLQRVLDTAKSIQGDIIVEITGDCPVIDWNHADFLIEKFFDNDVDYASNTIIRSFPDGFDTQVFSVSVLERVNSMTADISDHEHVSLFIYRHPELFRLYNWEAPKELNFPKYQVTLDTKEDYILIKKIFEALYKNNHDFTCEDVINFMHSNQELLEINKKIQRTQL